MTNVAYVAIHLKCFCCRFQRLVTWCPKPRRFPIDPNRFPPADGNKQKAVCHLVSSVDISWQFPNRFELYVCIYIQKRIVGLFQIFLASTIYLIYFLLWRSKLGYQFEYFIGRSSPLPFGLMHPFKGAGLDIHQQNGGPTVSPFCVRLLYIDCLHRRFSKNGPVIFYKKQSLQNLCLSIPKLHFCH